LLLVYTISKAPQAGWGSARTVTLPAVSAALLLAFLVVETRAAAPLMPLRIFRLRMVAVANTAGLLLGGSLFAFIFIGTLYMQQVLHYSALENRDRLARHLGHLRRARRSLTEARHPHLGRAGDGAGDGADRRRHSCGRRRYRCTGTSGPTSRGRCSSRGPGTAFALVPVSIGGLSGVAEHQAGLASGLINTSQQLGGAIGVAIASTVAASRLGTLLGEGKPASVALTGGFHWALWVCGAIALLALPRPLPFAAARQPPPPPAVRSQRPRRLTASLCRHFASSLAADAPG
jgi:hypothetical protein